MQLLVRNKVNTFNLRQIQIITKKHTLITLFKHVTGTYIRLTRTRLKTKLPALGLKLSQNAANVTQILSVKECI